MDCNHEPLESFADSVTISVGEEFTGTFETDCEHRIAKVYLEYGKVYQRLSGTVLDEHGFRINSYGGEDSRFFDAENRFSFFRARHSGYYYLVNTSEDDAGETFSASVAEIEEGKDTVFALNIGTGFAASGFLTADKRRVPHRLSLVPGLEYVINVFAADSGLGTLEDPWVGVDHNEEIYFDDNSGVGKEGRIRFRAEDSFAFVNVGGIGNGDYRLSVTQVDTIPAGTSTTARIDTPGLFEGFIDGPNDIDWVRVDLEKDKWYQFELSSSPSFEFPGRTLILRDPNKDVQEVVRTSPSYRFLNNGTNLIPAFQAQMSGDHFLIARSSNGFQTGKYRLVAREASAPLSIRQQNEAVNTNRYLSADDTVINLGTMVQSPIPVEEYQVYSSAPIYRDGVLVEAETIHSVPADELSSWTHQNNSEDTNEDILIRGKLGGTWSRWLSIPVFNYTTNPNLISSSTWEDPQNVTFSFPETLPDYYSGEYTGFDQLSAYASYTPLVNQLENFSLTVGEGNADINIFLADNVDGYLEAFLPGEGKGGDIILNKAYYNDDVQPVIGTRAHFEFMKGIMTALGLQEVSDSTARQSIMSTEIPEEGYYAYSPMPHDLRALQQLGFATSPLSVNYARDLQGYSVLTTSRLSRNEFPLSYADLRDGQWLRSTDTSRNVDREVYLMSEQPVYGLWPFQPRSVSGRQVLFGNGDNNELVGSNSADWLEGRQGDDKLLGGFGSDAYGYTFGGGNDVISESSSASGSVEPGRDRLRMIGYGPFQASLDQLRFTRTSFSDLTPYDDGPPINLMVEWLNEEGTPEGSVFINRQGWGSFRIESLELYDQSTEVAKLDLVDMFEQLAPGEPTQFDFPTPGDPRHGMSSVFGQLVNAIV